jgi:hypothetical protein
MSSSDPSEPNRSDNFSDNYNENYKTTPFSYNLIKNIANPFQDTPPKAVTPLDGSRRSEIMSIFCWDIIVRLENHRGYCFCFRLAYDNSVGESSFGISRGENNQKLLRNLRKLFFLVIKKFCSSGQMSNLIVWRWELLIRLLPRGCMATKVGLIKPFIHIIRSHRSPLPFRYAKIFYKCNY